MECWSRHQITQAATQRCRFLGQELRETRPNGITRDSGVQRGSCILASKPHEIDCSVLIAHQPYRTIIPSLYLVRSPTPRASEPPKPRYLEPSSDNGGGRDERASAAMQLSREIFQHCIKICRILKVVNLPRSPSLPLSLCSSSYHLPSSGPHSPLSLPLSSLITLITTRNWKEDSFVKKGKKGWVCDEGRGRTTGRPKPSPPPPPPSAANGSGGHLASARRAAGGERGRLTPPPSSPSASGGAPRSGSLRRGEPRRTEGSEEREEESSGFFPRHPLANARAPPSLWILGAQMSR